MSEEHIEECPCKRLHCERHGNCTACRAQHLAENRYLPACDRIRKKAERKAERQKK